MEVLQEDECEHSDSRKNNAGAYPDSSPPPTYLKTQSSSDRKLHQLGGGCDNLEIPKYSMASVGCLSPSCDSCSPRYIREDVFNVSGFVSTEYLCNVDKTTRSKIIYDLHRASFNDSSHTNTSSYSTDLSSSEVQQFVELVGNAAPEADYNQQSKYVFRSLHGISQNITKPEDLSSERGVAFFKALDVENNSLWFPPPPSNKDDEDECGFISYDDDDDSDDIEEVGLTLSSRSGISHVLSIKENQSGVKSESLKAVLQGHLRALVSQLLKGEGINIEKANILKGWSDIVTKVAWQSANFVKPDRSRGGSMDPGDYVKIKCIASGSPMDCAFVKGIVCTKNIKHKRMTSKYKNPSLMLIGGALEFQKLPNQLASIDKLLQQFRKLIISKWLCQR